MSITGTWMQVVAQNWLVLRLTGAATAVGVTVALQALPSVAFGLWGGVLADRLPKRTVCITTQLALAFLAAVLGIATLTSGVTIAFVYCLALALGLVMAMDAPSYAALGAELVPREILPNAIALGSIVNGLGRIIGMSLAGVLIAAIGPGMIFMLNAVSYLVVVAVLCTLPRTGVRVIARSPDDERGIGAALRFVARTPAILAAASIAFVVAAFGRNFQVTMAAMSKSVFGAGARGYGELSVIFAIGALFGGLVAARVRHHGVRIVIVVAGVASTLQIVSAFTPSFPTFAVAIFPIAISAVVFDTAALATVQLAAGDAHRGRVIALFTTMAMLGASAGAPTLGWLADHYGARVALALGGSVVLCGCMLQRQVQARYRTGCAPAGG